MHSISILEVKVSDACKEAVTNFIAKLVDVLQVLQFFYIMKFFIRCQCPDGGFGGGPGQKAHLATTYAAVNTLCIIGTEKAFNVINR